METGRHQKQEQNRQEFNRPYRPHRPRRPRVKLTGEELVFRLLIILIIVCGSIDIYLLCRELIPKGLSIDYDVVAVENDYQYQVDAVLNRLPDSVMKAANKEGLNIKVTSGKGETTVDVEPYIYAELGLEVPSENRASDYDKQKGNPILGCFVLNNKTIYIFVDNIATHECTGSSIEKTFSHELGHFIWHHILSDYDREEMKSYFASDELVNFGLYTKDNYCATSVQEYFAEFIEYYLRPDYDGTEEDWGTPNTLALVEGVLGV